ncbi:SurA N-terminal domain-containing protein [Oceanobacter mangrovi]|uniref:SurA N-terminal domain-containing protein n=1 Tax=Oceanobacter mangrovi TaxID=2862510 RepID=UPI001C8E75AB|nr:SurA N-terminal domain-containing protein [Oceanobacter mangrovi]
MLQTMRDNAQGIVAKIIVFFIIFVFALWGVESIVNLGGGDDAAIKVGDHEIYEADIQRVVEQQKANLRRQFGEQFDENLFNQDLLRQSAIEQLIQDSVEQEQARRLDIYAASSLVDQTIVSIPAFQLDGRFDKDQFLNVLRMNGWTPMTFRENLAGDIKTNQLRQAVSLSDFATPYQARFNGMLEGQLRTISWTSVNVNDLMASAEVSEDEVKQYYDANQERFKTPETVKVRYTGFDRAAIEAQQEVSEEDLQSAYKDYLSDLGKKEQRRSRHILIEVNDDRSDADALARAQEVEAKLKAGGDFAALAKEYSDDIGSASSGGELGFVGHGAFATEFEDKLFSMNAGDVSEPVKTEFGYHIINLEEVKAADTESMASKKAELENWIRSEKAKLFIAEQAQELGNLAFSAGSIDEVADSLGLKVQESQAFTRDSGDGIAANENVRQKAFAENILLDRELSDVVETDDGLYVFTVSEHNEPTTLPMAVVRAQIETTLKREKATSLAEQQAKAVASGEAEAEWTQLTTTFAQGNDLPRAAQAKAFGLAKGQSESVRVPAGYTVVRVEDIQTPAMDDVMADEDSLAREDARRARIALVSFRKWSRDNTEVVQ